MAENDLFLSIVSSRIELKLGVLERIVNRPTRKSARYRNHILLGIASVHAQRVQFHQLARIVLIETGPPYPLRHDHVIARDLRLPVIEVIQHRGMTGRRQKHVFEMSEHVRTNSVALVAGQQDSIRSLSVEYVKVIQPEVDEHFLQLPI